MCEMENTRKENNKQVQQITLFLMLQEYCFAACRIFLFADFRLNIFLHCEYSYIIEYDISVLECIWCLDVVKEIIRIDVLALYLISI